MQIADRDARHAVELMNQIGALQKAIEHMSQQINMRQAVLGDEEQTQLLDDMKDMQNASMSLKRRATSRLEYLTSLAENDEPSSNPSSNEVSASAAKGNNDMPSIPKQVSEHGDVVASSFRSKNPWVTTAPSRTDSEQPDDLVASPALSRGLSAMTNSEPASPDVFPPAFGLAPEVAPFSLTAQEFEEKLSSLLTSASEHHMGSSEPLSEDIIIHVSALLLAVGKNTWSERPRTYLVLRLINEVKVMDDIVLNGYKDIDFPYTESTTPECIKQLGIQHNFLHVQRYVLSEKSADLVQGGRHRHLGEIVLGSSCSVLTGRR
jgi:hypothetical protein